MCLVVHQVTTVAQARQAVERGVDAIIAQGEEAGGYVGSIATLALIPQVVDAVSPVPVVGAGGIADGRGLAAALVLGAVGVNVGTRFLATSEAQISPIWKQMIVDAAAEDAVKVRDRRCSDGVERLKGTPERRLTGQHRGDHGAGGEPIFAADSHAYLIGRKNDGEFVMTL